MINVNELSIVSNFDFELSNDEKKLIVEKLLEAHNLAVANLDFGNITNRGFAVNACSQDGIWALGTNFNNTRNEISSICAERSAVMSLFNKSLIKNNSKIFNFKVKYLCMAQAIDLNKSFKSAVPCEDCLAWFNTCRFFDDETIIFSFEKNENEKIILQATKLIEYLPYRNLLTSNVYNENKEIKYTDAASKSMSKFDIDEEKIKEILFLTYQNYKDITCKNISNQNISCSIYVNNKIYSSNKTDWTKRWFIEPLEYNLKQAIEENSDNIHIDVVSYFGDEFSGSKDEKFNDGVVSIKSLGRIRQKYAKSDTIIVLNLDNCIFVTTVGEFLPKKFVQGYKI